MVVLVRHRWRMVSVAHAEPRSSRRWDWVRDLDGITGAIIDASLHIHRDVGPRLLESVYEAVLARTMARQRFRVERQKAIRFAYDGMAFEEGQPSASSRLHVNQRVAAEPRGDGH
jgi:hypothetical protein